MSRLQVRCCMRADIRGRETYLFCLLDPLLHRQHNLLCP